MMLSTVRMAGNVPVTPRFSASQTPQKQLGTDEEREQYETVIQQNVAQSLYVLKKAIRGDMNTYEKGGRYSNYMVEKSPQVQAALHILNRAFPRLG